MAEYGDGRLKAEAETQTCEVNTDLYVMDLWVANFHNGLNEEFGSETQ